MSIRAPTLMWQTCFSLSALMLLALPLAAQENRGAPQVENSTVVSADRTVLFRLAAPQAKSVRLTSSDMPGLPPGGAEMKANEQGIWEFTSPVLPVGAYRYRFTIDGVSIVDFKNTATSQSNGNLWSLLTVSDPQADTTNPPRGAISEVHYFSKTLNRDRRLHVYTPPGYETSDKSYPVLYLLHGASDSDHSWSSVGQAGLILDQLIQAGKAKPMLVVMPMGHTGPFTFGPNNNFQKQMEEFEADFTKDVRPFVESHYRVGKDRSQRAIAGLSMGGAQTLNIAFSALGDYSAIGVFSSGIFGVDRSDNGVASTWVKAHEASMTSPELRKDLKLLWFATGKEDFLLKTSQATVQLFKDQGFNVTYVETEGGHTWLNWRDYLNQFVPALFN